MGTLRGQVSLHPPWRWGSRRPPDPPWKEPRRPLPPEALGLFGKPAEGLPPRPKDEQDDHCLRLLHLPGRQEPKNPRFRFRRRRHFHCLPAVLPETLLPAVWGKLSGWTPLASVLAGRRGSCPCRCRFCQLPGHCHSPPNQSLYLPPPAGYKPKSLPSRRPFGRSPGHPLPPRVPQKPPVGPKALPQKRPAFATLRPPVPPRRMEQGGTLPNVPAGKVPIVSPPPRAYGEPPEALKGKQGGSGTLGNVVWGKQLGVSAPLSEGPVSLPGGRREGERDAVCNLE